MQFNEQEEHALYDIIKYDDLTEVRITVDHHDILWILMVLESCPAHTLQSDYSTVKL